MHRVYEKKIQKWIEESKKSLLIYGARQVGKTWLIREMLRRNDVSFCEYNLIERSDILSILSSTSEASEISERLALYTNIPLREKESVIFLDEIQQYPDVITKIKFLVEEGRFRYIMSGSNLGVELKGIRSVPIGYMEEWQMMPMNFEEFALACGVGETALLHMRDCFQKGIALDELIHKKLLKAFYYYLVTGGMPAVINVYNESHSLERIHAEQKNIVNM